MDKHFLCILYLPVLWQSTIILSFPLCAWSFSDFYTVSHFPVMEVSVKTWCKSLTRNMSMGDGCEMWGIKMLPSSFSFFKLFCGLFDSCFSVLFFFLNTNSVLGPVLICVGVTGTRGAIAGPRQNSQLSKGDTWLSGYSKLTPCYPIAKACRRCSSRPRRNF